MVVQLSPGSVFARDYRVVRLMNEGGMGAIYEVEQESTGRRRALKIMSATLVRREDHRKRFLHEARIASRVESEHIVEVVGAGVDDETGTPWLAMELLRGEDIGTLMKRRGRLNPGEVLGILEHIGLGLGSAHRAGVIHLDLKPENLFVARRQEGAPSKVKVLDFGISKMSAENRLSVKVTSLIASPMWMAPEQAERGARATAATDVWALGLIVFHLLTGRYYWLDANLGPGEELNQMALLLEIGAKPLEPASVRAERFGVAAWLPAGFDAWFGRCVNRDLDARFADATAAVEALRPLLAASGEAPSIPSPRIDERPSEAEIATQTVPDDPPTEPLAPRSFEGPHAVNAPAPVRTAHYDANPSSSATQSTASTRSSVEIVATGEVQASSRTRPVLHPPTRRRTAIVASILALTAVAAIGARLITRDPEQPRLPPQAAQPHDPSTARVASPSSAPLLMPIGTLVATTNPWVHLPEGLDVEQHEVSRGEFTLWWRSSSHPSGATLFRPPENEADERLPAVFVSQEEAMAFCVSLGDRARLPTRQEWRLVLGQDRGWSRGVPVESTVHSVGESTADRRPIDTTAVFDLVGNVSEWTVDRNAQLRALAMGAFFREPPDTIAGYLREGSWEPSPSAHIGFRCVR